MTKIKTKSPAEIVRAHTPSLTRAAEDIMDNRMFGWEAADLAVRQCACGVMIDGFYEYADHLVALLQSNPYEETEGGDEPAPVDR